MTQDVEVEQLAFINLDGLIEMSDGDNDFIVEILQTVIDSCNKTVSTIEQHCDRGDMNELAFTFHKFKSTVHVLGNSKLTSLIGNLELATKKQSVKESIHGDIENLKTAITKLINKLSVEITKIK